MMTTPPQRRRPSDQPGKRPDGTARKRSGKKSSSSSSNNGLLLGVAIGGGVIALVAAIVIGVLLGRGSAPPAPAPVSSDVAVAETSPEIETSAPLTSSISTTPITDVPASTSTDTALASNLNSNLNTTPMGAVTTSADLSSSADASLSADTSLKMTSNPIPQTSSESLAMDLPTLIEQVEKSIVRITVKSEQGEGLGSGFVVDAAGIIVTNYHVMEGAVSAVAEFRDGTSYPIAGFLKLDDERDLAVLKIEAKETLYPLAIAKELPRKGIKVATFGAPRGLSFSNSEGIVSALRSAEELKHAGSGNYIQTTAAISGGNSGGPLVNMQGEVVGANTFKRTDGESLNFAISCLDITDMVNNRGTKLTAVSPETIPVKISGGEYGGAEDLTGTERGNLLLSQIREAVIITAPFNYDRTGRITDFVVSSAEHTFKERMKWKSIRSSSEVKGSSAIVFVAIYFTLTEGAEEDLVSDLNVHTVIVSRDVDKDGKEIRAIVLDEKGVVGTASIRTVFDGVVSRTMQSGTKEYFTKLVGQYRKSIREVGK